MVSQPVTVKTDNYEANEITRTIIVDNRTVTQCSLNTRKPEKKLFGKFMPTAQNTLSEQFMHIH